MQADQITSFVFSKLIRQARGKELLDLLEFLEARVYSKLEAAYEPTIRKLQVGLQPFARVQWPAAATRQPKGLWMIFARFRMLVRLHAGLLDQIPAGACIQGWEGE